MTNENTTESVAQFAPSIKMHHATRAKATKLMAMLAAEYPKLALMADTTEDEQGNEVLAAFEVEFDGEDELIYSGDKVPSIAELLDTCAERELDPQADEEDEEPKASGSVVPEHYRRQYKAASTNGQSCGDWLAEWLVAETNNGKGFNVEDFTAICHANDLDMSRGWALLPTSGQAGWMGRYRMNGRQVMEKVIARHGQIKDAMGQVIVPPAAFVETMQTKHAKWLAKELKAEAAAEAAMGKVEGEDDQAA